MAGDRRDAAESGRSDARPDGGVDEADSSRAPDLSRARADAVVAGTAAAATVGLAIALRFGAGVDASLLVRIAPLGVYGLYALTRRGGPHGPRDRPRNWALLSVAIGVVAFVATVG
jgi:hypothetical protein